VFSILLLKVYFWWQPVYVYSRLRGEQASAVILCDMIEIYYVWFGVWCYIQHACTLCTLINTKTSATTFPSFAYYNTLSGAQSNILLSDIASQETARFSFSPTRSSEVIFTKMSCPIYIFPSAPIMHASISSELITMFPICV